MISTCTYITRYDTKAATTQRTLESVCQSAEQSILGVTHKPLINIEIDKVIKMHDLQYIMMEECAQIPVATKRGSLSIFVSVASHFM